MNEDNPLLQQILKGDPKCLFKVGNRVEKANSGPEDRHKDGTKGTVLGSIQEPERGTDLYLVEFDGDTKDPETPICAFTIGRKLLPA